MYNLVLWNFSASATDLDLTLQDLPKKMRVQHITLDATTGSDDENARLHPEPPADLNQGNQTLHMHLEPYAVHYWSYE
jgi:hypothetical protein